MAESVPYTYVAATGVIIPDTSQLLTDVQTEYQDVFGTDLIVTPDTPQGLLISAEALSRSAVIANNAVVANQINPNIAGGTFLDAVMALTGMQRTAQTQTVVPGVTLAGVAGTIIPAGSLAQTAAGDQFQTLSQVTLAANGQATVNFASVAYGAIPCAAGALTQIVSSVLGWETVTNATAGMLGATTQSDQAARALRQNTLAFQGVSLAVAITSALYATAGVTSLAFRENYTKADTTIDGIFLLANSVYACVAGGSDLDVAAALLENKSSGCNWNGGTTVTLVEPASGQTYPVKFDRPTPVGILVQVTTPNGNVGAITQSILDYAAGLVQVTDQSGSMGTLPGFTVGASVSPFDIAAAIVAENPGVYLSNIQISLISPINFSSNPIAISLNQQAYTQASFVTVNVT